MAEVVPYTDGRCVTFRALPLVVHTSALQALPLLWYLYYKVAPLFSAKAGAVLGQALVLFHRAAPWVAFHLFEFVQFIVAVCWLSACALSELWLWALRGHEQPYGFTGGSCTM